MRIINKKKFIIKNILIIELGKHHPHTSSLYRRLRMLKNRADGRIFFFLFFVLSYRVHVQKIDGTPSHNDQCAPLNFLFWFIAPQVELIDWTLTCIHKQNSYIFCLQFFIEKKRKLFLLLFFCNILFTSNKSFLILLNKY